MLTKSKKAYENWFRIVGDFPKLYRYSLGSKIEDSFLDMLEYIFSSIYLPPEQKIVTLGRAIAKLNAVQFFLQIAWENKCVQSKQYALLSEQLEEVGKMLGGWKKNLDAPEKKNRNQ